VHLTHCNMESVQNNLATVRMCRHVLCYPFNGNKTLPLILQQYIVLVKEILTYDAIMSKPTVLFKEILNYAAIMSKLTVLLRKY